MGGGAQYSLLVPMGLEIPSFGGGNAFYPYNVPLGFLAQPSRQDDWLIKLAAVHVGGDIENWGKEEWQKTACYLAGALDILARIDSNKGQELIQRPPKRPVGRPAKARVSRLTLGLLGGNQAPRSRGRPRKITEEFWKRTYEVVELCRAELIEQSPSGRVRDIDAIRALVRHMQKSRRKSDSWARRTIPKVQKLYSEAKRRVGKIEGNS